MNLKKVALLEAKSIVDDFVDYDNWSDKFLNDINKEDYDGAAYYLFGFCSITMPRDSEVFYYILEALTTKG